MSAAFTPPSAIDQLLDAMAQAGIKYDDKDPIIGDGTLHRFHVEGDPSGVQNGWYCFHDDATPAGNFGCMKRLGPDTKLPFSAKRAKPLTPQEKAALAAKMAAQKAKREAEDKAKHDAAAVQANAIWAKAYQVGKASHPYLLKKGIQAHGTRISPFSVRQMQDDGSWANVLVSENALLIPRRSHQREIVSLQAIFPNADNVLGRDRTYLANGEAQGTYETIGQTQYHEGCEVFLLCEGFATGAALHESTGHCAVVAFDAGNLIHVAKRVRAQCPEALIIIAADNDQWTTQPVPNPGLYHAKQAADAVEGHLVYPPFPASLGDLNSDGKLKGPTDFDDLRRLQGNEAVKSVVLDCLNALQTPNGPQGPTPGAAVPALPCPGSEEKMATAGQVAPLEGELMNVEEGNEVLVYDITAPLAIAQGMVARLWTHEDVMTLYHHHDYFYEWTGTHYAKRHDKEIRAVVYCHLNQARQPSKTTKGTGELRPIKPNSRLVNNVMDALKATCLIEDEVEAPSWLRDVDIRQPANHLISCTNGLYDWQENRLLAHTPAYYSHSCLAFAYHRDASTPKHWYTFLDTLWPNDPEAIAVLQMMFGYLLTQSTYLQKVFLLVGPPRSGKGTILKVLTNMLGRRNVCSPRLRDLAKDFGLASMIGKQAALVGDARLTGRIDQAEMTENLLSISGEDAVSINRKNKSYWEGRLKVRFVICTNVVPMVSDASGAIASRFVALVMKHSFLGKENHRLQEDLSEEMPGILNWAIEGLRQLEACGRIESPASARETLNELDELSSPVKAFVSERCRTGPSFRIPTLSLYEAWRHWNHEKGRDHISSDAVFGRDLRAAVSTVIKKSYDVPNSHSRKRQNYYEGITLN